MNSISTYKISIKGLNIHHILSYFEKEKIHLSNAERINHNKLACVISSSDYKKLKSAPISKNYKIRIEQRYGFENYTRGFLRKLGLITGVIIMALTTLKLTKTIQEVNVNFSNHICQNGNQCVFYGDNLNSLYKELEAQGIKGGQSVYKLPSNKEFKQNIMLKFPQISDVSLKRQGVRINIEILEGKLPTNQIKTNLIAEESGIVIKTDVTSGKLKVKIGDIVLKGDTLIENTGTPACGTVILRSFYHENLIFNEKQTTYERTGNKMHINHLSMFGFNLKSSKICNYNLYETEISQKYLSVNSLLPIKINHTTYYELKKTDYTLSFNEAKDTLYKELEEKTRQLVPLNAKIKNTTYSLKQEGSRYLITCYIETYLTLSI